MESNGFDLLKYLDAVKKLQEVKIIYQKTFEDLNDEYQKLGILETCSYDSLFEIINFDLILGLFCYLAIPIAIICSLITK
ncbi:MAG: hypothetical protein K2H29_00370, partial [Oscillospiraceae bacterium]|nr:hypothetical protein [Oscillospiraceae bacterium]